MSALMHSRAWLAWQDALSRHPPLSSTATASRLHTYIHTGVHQCLQQQPWLRSIWSQAGRCCSGAQSLHSPPQLCLLHHSTHSCRHVWPAGAGSHVIPTSGQPAAAHMLAGRPHKRPLLPHCSALWERHLLTLALAGSLFKQQPLLVHCAQWGILHRTLHSLRCGQLAAF